MRRRPNAALITPLITPLSNLVPGTMALAAANRRAGGHCREAARSCARPHALQTSPASTRFIFVRTASAAAAPLAPRPALRTCRRQLACTAALAAAPARKYSPPGQQVDQVLYWGQCPSAAAGPHANDRGFTTCMRGYVCHLTVCMLLALSGAQRQVLRFNTTAHPPLRYRYHGMQAVELLPRSARPAPTSTPRSPAGQRCVQVWRQLRPRRRAHDGGGGYHLQLPAVPALRGAVSHGEGEDTCI